MFDFFFFYTSIQDNELVPYHLPMVIDSFFYYHYELMYLNISGGFNLLQLIQLIEAWIVPSLASKSLIKLLLSPFNLTVVVLANFIAVCYDKYSKFICTIPNLNPGSAISPFSRKSS